MRLTVVDPLTLTTHRHVLLHPQSINSNAATFLLCLFLSACVVSSRAQTAPPKNPDAAALVRRAIQHRLDAAKNRRPLQYLVHRVDERRDTTKAIIETSDGSVARLIAVDGKPLSVEADQVEIQRLNTLSDHPELQEHRRKNEQRDADRVNHLLSLMPDAFKYQLEGIVPCHSGQCYHLSFTPNPSFTPPDLESNVFRGIAGEMLIDHAQERLERLDARFVSDVDFGFGILGKLNKGGTVRLEQSDVGGSDWELTTLEIHVTGKALMVRSFNFQVTEHASHFSETAPGLHYRDAITLLKKYDPTQATSAP